MKPIFIIDDDPLMAKCVALSVQKSQPEAPVQIFPDAVAAINALNEDLPGLIFLDVLLTGPNGFTFLNEIASYSDTAKIPIILMSSLDLTGFDLKHYNVKKILQKETMTPDQIAKTVEEFYA